MIELPFVCNDKSSAEPTPRPTSSPTPPYALNVFSGFNIFTAEISAMRPLDTNYASEMIKTSSPEASVCEYSSMDFEQGTSSFSEYSEQFGIELSGDYGLGLTDALGGAGSLSYQHTETRSYSSQGDYQIFEMDFECTFFKVELQNFASYYWDVDFIYALSQLPRNYTISNRADFAKIWERYGTHIFKSARLGGSIKGTTVMSSCKLEEAFEDSTSLDACLSAQYKGINGSACASASDSFKEGSTFSTSLKNTQIVVKGGSGSGYSDIFSAFGDKSGDFDEWVSELTDYPYVIGGTLVSYQDAIVEALDSNLAEHQLDLPLLANGIDPLGDDWRFVAAALNSAFDDYSSYLDETQNSFNASGCDAFDECDALGLSVDTTDCKCDCSGVEECCPVTESKSVKDDSIGAVATGFIVVAAVVSPFIIRVAWAHLSHYFKDKCKK